MGHRIVFSRHEAWPEVPLAITSTLTANFLARLDAHILNLAVRHHNVAAFIDGVSAGDLVPVFFRREFHAVLAAVLFVALREENHVAVEPRSGTLQRDQHGQIRDGHSLVVIRAAPIEIIVFDHRAERDRRSTWPCPRPRHPGAPLAEGRATDRASRWPRDALR